MLAAFALAAAPSDPPQALQHGLRIGAESEILFGAPDAPIGANPRTQNLLADRLRPPVPAGVSYAEFETWVEGLPADFAESVTFGCNGSREGSTKVAFDRYVRDYFRKMFVRYAMTVEALPTGSYRVSFAASDVPPPTEVTAKPGWEILTPAHFPVPQIFNEGDEIPLVLATSPNGAQLVDYIHLGDPARMPKRKESPRDSYAEDSEFALAHPSLRVDGEPRPAIAFPESLRGEVLWLYVPGQGRYILSFLPHSAFGFSKLGEVAGNLMTLATGEGNLLRVLSKDRIAPGGGVYNVYGIRDSRWQPADAADRGRFMAGTSPAVETALPRR